MLERQNREIKRRTRVATLFPNEASALRLVTAVLVEISEEWEIRKGLPHHAKNGSLVNGTQRKASGVWGRQ